jgi:L-threonylcarbamoyladenylate synthase
MKDKPDQDRQVEEAVEVIKKGGLVAFPTDTVYCLGADPTNSEAVAKIFIAKQRPLHMALPVIVASMEQLQKVCEVSPLALFLAKEFFPVGFTLVMPKSPKLPNIVTAGKKSVAVRIQDNPVATMIAAQLEMGVVGTSANVHDMKSPVTGDEVKKQLGSDVDLIIYGECSGGIESTIVDVTGDEPVILREGAVPAAKVNQAWEKFKRKKKPVK